MACPMCDRPTVKDYRPFCSKRCADKDLGKWLTGAYAIPATPDDEMDDYGEADGQNPEETSH